VYNYFLFCFIFIGIAKVSGQTIQGFSLPDGNEKVTIPIEVHNNLIVVPLILNNTLPLKFIVDTGVRTAILFDKTFTDLLLLPYLRKYALTGPGNQKYFEAYVTTNVALSLPGIHSEGHALLVLEQDYLQISKMLGIDVHGILGYELFSRFIVKVDYERNTMTLYKPGNFKIHKRFKPISIAIEDTKPFIMCTAKLNENSSLDLKLLVDTGASHGLMLNPTSNDGIKVPDKNVSGLLGFGLGGEITGKISRIETLTIGRYTLPGVIVSFPDPNSYTDSLSDSKFTLRDGSVGGEILNRFTVIFDYPNELIYLRPNSSHRKKFYFGLSGLDLHTTASRSFKVIFVRDSSPAQIAGMESGDEIVKVDGTDTRNLLLSEVNSLLNRKPFKKIKVTFLRANKEHTKKLLLIPQI